MIMNERGLTLAEILVAVSIIALGLVGLAVVVPVASYGVQEGSQLSTATFLAEQRIEQVRNATWSQTPVPNGTDCVGLSVGNTAPITATGCTTSVPSAIAVGGVTFPDENNVQWGNDARIGTSTTNPLAGGYTRTTRIAQCTNATCGGVTPTPPTTTDMRLVTVTVTYRPLTSAGAAPTMKTVSLQWVVAQK